MEFPERVFSPADSVFQIRQRCLQVAPAAAFDELTERWGQRYPAVIRLWDNAWAEFIPFLDYDVEIRRVICFTNAIEALNARYKRAVKARGHFLLVTWNEPFRV